MTDTSNQGQAESRGLQFFRITDFSPGIFDNSVIAFGNPGVRNPGVLPAPLGAADINNTIGCIALANGGLGPLPALFGAPGVNGLSLSDIGISVPGAADITAFINSEQNQADELVIGVTPAPSAGAQTTHFYSYLVGGASLNSIQSQSYTFTSQKNFCCFPFSTTILQAGTPQPVVCLPLAAPDGPNSNLMVYPAPSAPTVFGVSTISTAASADGTSFGHQGRIVVQSLLSGYGWPVGKTYSPNEQFNYTDPPQTQTWPVQAEIFGPENPFGYGALTSVSAGELFCVKVRGGAIIIQGDLNNPTVTNLPGVKSTGVIFGRSDSDQNGSYYCADGQGAWLWNGGNASQKISSQLDDNFYKVSNPISNTHYYAYYCQRWSGLMLFSNNWIFNAQTGGWWRLENPATQSYYYYAPGFGAVWMFAAKQAVTSGSEKFLFEYNLQVPRATWTWQSLPIKLPSDDRTATVREITIRASNPYADVAPSFTVSLIDDKGNVSALDTWHMATGSQFVQEARLNAGMRQTTTVALRVVASGTSAAPVLYALGVGERTREHTGLV